MALHRFCDRMPVSVQIFLISLRRNEFAALFPVLYNHLGARGVLPEVDRTMEIASEGCLAANQRIAQATPDFEAVQAGRQTAANA